MLVKVKAFYYRKSDSAPIIIFISLYIFSLSGIYLDFPGLRVCMKLLLSGNAKVQKTLFIRHLGETKRAENGEMYRYCTLNYMHFLHSF